MSSPASESTTKRRRGASSGAILRAAQHSADIAARKLTDNTAFQLAAIVESSDDAIVGKDLNGIIRSWNKGAERIFGYKPEEVIGKPITILIPQERLDEEPKILARLRRGERIDHFETVRKARDGTLLDISVTVSPVRNAEGTLIGASKIARDITEYKRSRDQRQALFQLVESANRATSVGELFEAALNSMSQATRADRVAILLYDEDRVMRFKAWRNLSDAYRAAVEGHSPWHADDRNPRPVCINDVKEVPLEEHLREVIAREGIAALAFIPIVYERQLLGKFMIYYDQPHRFTSEQTEPAETMATQVAFGLQRQRRAENLERLVSERTASLREAIQQMEEFSYTISHDLRAPLRGMQVYSEAVLEDYSQALPDEAKRYLQRITDNAARLDKMVLDLLTFSRVARAEIRLEPVSLGKLVRDVIDRYPALQRPAAEIQLEPLAEVLGHESSLTQALSNLLMNAVKFKKAGSIPTVRVRTEESETTVRIWIEDNGIGIDPRSQHRLFNMFERIHKDAAYEGTGVGLAIVRRAAERMGGKVGVESDGLNGSRFWIDLQKVAKGG